MNPPGDDLDRLLENASWVRALGVELAGVGEADDLAQDAWVIALERRGGARNPAAWLSGIVRHLAGRRRRGEERRTRRERAVARPEAEPGPDELVAEAELSRELIRAVTELEEPYRSTVLLRFYRGWTGEEIAASQGVPGATVRTRLARALAELRTRLDRQHGGREAWALVFAAPAGLAPGAAVSPVPLLAEGALMGSKVLYGGAAALVALAGLAVWQTTRDADGVSARVEGVAAAADGRPSEPAGVVPEPASAAEARAAPAAQRSATVASSPVVEEVLLHGAVVDREGQPLEFGFLRVEDDLGASRDAAESPAGAYSIAGLTPGHYTLRVRAKGFVSLREELELAPDRLHQRHDLVLEKALAIPVRVRDEQGALVGFGELDPRERQLAVVVTREAPHDGLFGFVGDPGSRLGWGEFIPAEPGSDVPSGFSGFVRLLVRPPVHVSLVVHDAVLETRRVEGELDALEFTLARGQIASRLGGLRARFVDATTGRPIPGGAANLDAPSTYSMGGTKLGDDAVAVFAEHAPGFFCLRFFHPEYEALARGVRVPSGTEADLGDVLVWPHATIRGAVLDSRGEPLQATVRWLPAALARGPQDLQWGGAVSTSGGRLELPKVSRGTVRLFVKAKGHALFTRTVDTSSGLAEGLVLQLEEGTSVAFRPGSALGRQLTLADANGIPFVTWNLWDGTITTQLVPGVYQLWLGEAERVDSVEELVVGREPVVKTIGRER